MPKGARFTYSLVVPPDLRIDAVQLGNYLGLAQPGAHNLFAFLAQSNFSGVQHLLEIIAQSSEGAPWSSPIERALDPMR
jgi:hypothetical protein